MSMTRATAFMGEGHYGMKRCEQIAGDPYAFMDHTPIDIEPISNGKIKREMLPSNQRFLAEIRKDVQAGRLNPAEIISGGRRKSPKSA